MKSRALLFAFAALLALSCYVSADEHEAHHPSDGEDLGMSWQRAVPLDHHPARPVELCAGGVRKPPGQR